MKQLEKIALIIENDDSIEVEALGYIHDNPELFDRVEKVTYAIHRMQDVSLMLSTIPITDIVAVSTFMYKDQVENMALILNAKGRPFRIHIQYMCRKMNDFLETRNGSLTNAYFWDQLDIMTILSKNWASQGRLFEIETDYDNPVPKDEFTSRFDYRSDGKRSRYKSVKVLYSEEHNVFYREGEDPEKEVKLVHIKS